MKLTRKELKFCELILQGESGTKAYKLAGFKAKSDNSASVLAGRKLRKVHVAKYITDRTAELNKKVQEETLVTKREVILELKRIGFSRINRILEFSKSGVSILDSKKIVDDDLAAIQSIREGKDGIYVKLYDKVGPLTKLGEHLGIFQPDGSTDNPRAFTVNINVTGSDRSYKINIATD